MAHWISYLGWGRAFKWLTVADWSLGGFWPWLEPFSTWDEITLLWSLDGCLDDLLLEFLVDCGLEQGRFPVPYQMIVLTGTWELTTDIVLEGNWISRCLGYPKPKIWLCGQIKLLFWHASLKFLHPVYCTQWYKIGHWHWLTVVGKCMIACVFLAHRGLGDAGSEHKRMRSRIRIPEIRTRFVVEMH